jgi:hypothetical protein
MLEELLSDVGDEAKNGVTLINRLYFAKYIKNLCEETNDVDFKQFPFNCIDWGKASDMAEIDYTTVEFDGYTFYHT